MLRPKAAKAGWQRRWSTARCLTDRHATSISPIDMATVVGTVTEATREQAEAAQCRAAQAGFAGLERQHPPPTAPHALDRAAELLDQRKARFIALLQREGGKTLDDALSEVREAIDFCRYYAAEGRKLFGADQPLPGPTGESNALRLRGRGVVRRDLALEFPAGDFPQGKFRRR